MISRTHDALWIDGDCRQASCHFDKDLFGSATAEQFGLVLPPTLARAVQKRQAEFIAGRYCARQALEQLSGMHSAVVGIGAHREPLWPQGVVGSITHTHGFAAAVVASSHKVRGLGMDSEAWLTPASAQDLDRQILTAGESYTEHRDMFESQRHYLTLVFSAKESLYKCLFPLVGRFFGFHAAVITPQPPESPTNGRFRYELLETLNAEFCRGYSGYGSYAIGDELVHTAVVLKALDIQRASD